MGLNPVTTLPYIVHLKSHTCDERQRLRGLYGEHGGTSSDIPELFFPKKKAVVYYYCFARFVRTEWRKNYTFVFYIKLHCIPRAVCTESMKAHATIVLERACGFGLRV